MYDKVKEVLEAETREEAERRFFGEEGIRINTKEYYELIISKFVKKKDNIIPKTKGKLVFDVDKNGKEIENIVFISEYVKEKFFSKYEPVINELEKEIEIAKNDVFLGKINQIDFDKLNEKLNSIKNYFENVDSVKLISETIESGDEEKIEKEIRKLKQGLLVLHKIRNAFEHNDGVKIKDGYILIDSTKDILNIRIPLEYLDGFTKGRIIVKEEDKKIKDVADEITVPILEYFNYDTRKLESFFYNIPPDSLSKIYDYFGNDSNVIYNFSITKLKNVDAIIYFLESGFNVETVAKLDYFVFFNYKITTKLLLAGIPVEILNDKPVEIIYNSDAIIKFLDLGMDLESVIKIPTVALENYDGVMRFVEMGMSIENAVNIPQTALQNPDGVMRFVEMGMSIENAVNIPQTALQNPDCVMKFVKMGMSLESAANIPTAALENYDGVMRFVEMGMSIENAVNIPQTALKNPDCVMKFVKMGMSIENAVNIPESLLENPDGVRALLKMGVHWDEMKILPKMLFSRYEKTITLMKLGMNIKMIAELSPNIFVSYDFFVNNLKKIPKELISKLPKTAFQNFYHTRKLYDSGIIDDVIEKLPDFAFKNSFSAYRFLKSKISAKRLSKLPEKAFQNDEAVFELMRLGVGFDFIFSLSEEAYEHIDDVIIMLKAGIKKDKLKYVLNTNLDGIFRDIDFTISLLKSNVDIQDSSEYFNFICEIKKALSLGMSWEQISKLSVHELLNLELINIFKSRGIDFDVSLFEDTSLDFFNSFVSGGADTDLLCKLLDSGVELDTIARLPKSFFAERPGGSVARRLLKSGVDLKVIKNLPEVAFGSFDDTFDLLNFLKKRKVSFNEKLSEKLFDYGLGYDNLEFLLSRVNNKVELLEQFPIEFFRCDINILKEMCGKYDYNLCRSIFGINDHKKISLLLYMNSVFSKYDKNNDGDNMRLSPFDIINNTAELTEKYASINDDSNNLKLNRTDYIKKIVYDKERLKTPEEMKEYIIRKLRNSSAHFRYRIVKDENGNIDDDKIELYDEDNRGKTNYIGVFDMNYLLEVTRLCELDIEKKFDTEEVGRSR